MSTSDRPTLGEAILAQARGVQSRARLHPVDFVKSFTSHPSRSRPAGSVALDFTCDKHGGRLMRLWMSPQAGEATFGGEGVKEAWNPDPSDGDVVVVTCIRQGCHNSARLTTDWLEASFRRVRADFEAGKGLPIASCPLSQVDVPSGG